MAVKKKANKERTLVESLKYIVDNGFCSYNYYKAKQEWNKIKDQFNSADQEELKSALIRVDPDYPDCLDYRGFSDVFNTKIKQLEENK